MLNKIKSFGKKGIKQGIKKITKTKSPKPNLRRTTITKNIGGGKKIVSSKPKPTTVKLAAKEEKISWSCFSWWRGCYHYSCH